MEQMITEPTDFFVISGIDSEYGSSNNKNAHLFSKLIDAADEYYKKIPANQPYKSYELYTYILKNVDDLLSQKAQAQLINSEKSIIVVNTKNDLLGVSSKGLGQNILGQVLLSIRSQLKFRNKNIQNIQKTYTPEDFNRPLPLIAIAEDPCILQEIRAEAKKLEYISPPLPPLPLKDMEAFNKIIHKYTKRTQRYKSESRLHEEKKEGKKSVSQAKSSHANLKDEQEISNVSVIIPEQKNDLIGNSATRRSVFFKEKTNKSNPQTYTDLNLETKEHITHIFSQHEVKIDDHANVFTFGEHQFVAEENQLTTNAVDEKTFNMMLLLHINVFGANSLPTIETQPHLEALWREACVYTYGNDIGNQIPIEITSPASELSFK